MIIILANVYFLNVDHLPFLRSLIPALLEFQEGTLIFGGDLNFAMDSALDVSRGTSHLSYSHLKRLKAELSDSDYSFFNLSTSNLFPLRLSPDSS